MANHKRMRPFAASVLVLALACVTPATVPTEGARNADELMIVDCLLPGQVRKMGSSLTYMTPRRPIKTSAVDCEIRGGEYVAFDRGSYADSLRIWLPRAKEGDAQAQTYVGEIFEKGLGVTPDYTAAAEWYLRAANQGYGPAQINIGQLYELGLGVPQDAKIAMSWYRRAAGIEDLDVEFVTFVGEARQFEKLRRELAVKNDQVDVLSGQLASLNRELGQAREQRANRQEFVSSEQGELASLRDQVAREGKDVAARRAALAQEFAALEKQRAAASADGRRQSELDELARLLGEQRRELDTYVVHVRTREQDLVAREQTVEQRNRELAELDAKVQSLDKQAQARLEQYAMVVQPAVPGVMPGPNIQIVDPELLLTRSIRSPSHFVSSKERAIIGRVEAPAGLLSLVVNDVEVRVDDAGFFESNVRVRPTGTQVRLVAIDHQGKRTTRSFTLRRGDEATNVAEAPVALNAVSTGVDFGRYYALVIGISNYQHLPQLMTSTEDARAVAGMLETRYGFEVTRLIDADRYAILSALNSLREKLGEKDNLIVYYAGHGEFDETNDRGYWLPVEAETENRANWISNQSVTDIVNAMAARHVLVIADSCYSGALTQSSIPITSESLEGKERASWQSLLSSKRSRTALTSGGLAPVLDGGGGANSLFADAFLDILRSNDDVLDGRTLYESLAARVTYRARTRSFRQEPQYAPIRYGGHEAGDFFLVPQG